MVDCLSGYVTLVDLSIELFLLLLAFGDAAIDIDRTHRRYCNLHVRRNDSSHLGITFEHQDTIELPAVVGEVGIGERVIDDRRMLDAVQDVRIHTDSANSVSNGRNVGATTVRQSPVPSRASLVTSDRKAIRLQ